MEAASEGALKGVLGYSDEPLVSIFDALSTKVMDGNFAQILSWYDNEWGFSKRIGDVTKMIERGDSKIVGYILLGDPCFAPTRHDPERHPQRVHGSQHLHLSARRRHGDWLRLTPAR